MNVFYWSGLILEQKDLAFLERSYRYPLQSCEPNTGSQGFSLLSGLKGGLGFFAIIFETKKTVD
jgi:hypothetical protein